LKQHRYDLDQILKILYYVVFVLLVIFQFEKSTMFHIIWPAYFGDYIYAGAVLISLLRVFRAKNMQVRRLLILSAIGFILAFSWHTKEQMALLPVAALILGADGIDLRKLLKIFVITEAALFAATCVAAAVKFIPDLVYEQKIHDFKQRHSFGFIYPTDCCAHWLFLVLSFVWLRDKKLTLVEMLLIPISGVLCLRFCDARTTAILLILLIFGAAVLRGGAWFFQKENKVLHILAGIVGIGTAAIIPIFSIVIHMIYDPKIAAFKRLDQVLSHRLALGKLGIDMYGIKLWGQYVSMNGAGGSLLPKDNYFFIDSSFLLLLLSLGAAAFLVIYFMFVVISIAEWKKRNYLQLWIIVIISLTCFMEHHFFDVSYNPILFFFLSGFDMLFFSGRKRENDKVEV